MRGQQGLDRAGHVGLSRQGAAESLPRAEILRRKADVEGVFRSGRRVRGSAVWLRCASSREPRAAAGRRVAFLVSRQAGKAVVRNQLKRRLREIYRRNKHWFPVGHDYALQATPGAAGLGFAELLECTRQLTRRLCPDGRPA